MLTLIAARIFLAGLRIDYNLFRPQDDLDGSNPAEAAATDGPFSSWKDVVKKGESIAAANNARARNAAARRSSRVLATCDSTRLIKPRTGCD